MTYRPALAPLIVVPVLLLSVPATAANASICAREADPGISVELMSVAPTRDLSRDSRRLTAVPGRGHVPAGAAGGRVLGLSTARLAESSRVDIHLSILSDGSFCATVSGVAAAFGFDQRRVFIANELPEGSCAFDEVLAHEMRHVRVDDEASRAFLPKVEARLRAEALAAPPLRSRDRRGVVEAQQRRVRAAMRSLLDEFSRERDRLQAAVDTTDEYKRVTASCGGEIAKLLPPGGRM